jgi:hypothetical protein
MLHLRIPPLRERREDIQIIADKLVEQLAHDMKRGPVEISESVPARRLVAIDGREIFANCVTCSSGQSCFQRMG